MNSRSIKGRQDTWPDAEQKEGMKSSTSERKEIHARTAGFRSRRGLQPGPGRRHQAGQSPEAGSFLPGRGRRQPWWHMRPAVFSCRPERPVRQAPGSERNPR